MIIRTVSNSEDLIDSRDVIERIDELEADDERDEDDDKELRVLRELAEECEQYAPDWQWGATLIRESYFTEYAEQLAEDIGAISSDAQWPLSYIDWEAAAEALLQDYTGIDFDRVTYYAR